MQIPRALEKSSVRGLIFLCETDYRHWIDRMLEYGFTQGADFNMVKNDRVQAEGNRKVKRMVDDVVMTIILAR
jgi:phage anti-repressor protein